MSPFQLVLYDAGVDIAFDDTLGYLNISHRGIYERDHYVLSECRRRGIPVAGVRPAHRLRPTRAIVGLLSHVHVFSPTLCLLLRLPGCDR